MNERERLHQAAIDMRQTTRRRFVEDKVLCNMPMRDRTCPASGERIKCKEICNPLKGEPCLKWLKWQENLLFIFLAILLTVCYTLHS